MASKLALANLCAVLALAANNESDCISRINNLNACEGDWAGGCGQPGRGTCRLPSQCTCSDGTCARLTLRLGSTCKVNTKKIEYLGTYKISNARWPDYWMQMGTLGGGSVTADSSGDDTAFHFYTVINRAAVAVIIVSKKWPDWVLAMDEGISPTGLTMNSYEMDEDTESVDTMSILSKPPGNLTVDELSHDNATLVMIRGNEHGFAFVPKGGWDVSGHKEDQGAGMYWYISPPLPDVVVAKLLPYEGPTCAIDCGDIDDHLVSSAYGQLLPHVALFVAAALSFHL